MTNKPKNPAAVALGRLGGLASKGGRWKGRKGFATLTPEQRTAVAKKAARARWAKNPKTPQEPTP